MDLKNYKNTTLLYVCIINYKTLYLIINYEEKYYHIIKHNNSYVCKTETKSPSFDVNMNNDVRMLIDGIKVSGNIYNIYNNKNKLIRSYTPYIVDENNLQYIIHDYTNNIVTTTKMFRDDIKLPYFICRNIDVNAFNVNNISVFPYMTKNDVLINYYKNFNNFKIWKKYNVIVKKYNIDREIKYEVIRITDNNLIYKDDINKNDDNINNYLIINKNDTKEHQYDNALIIHK